MTARHMFNFSVGIGGILFYVLRQLNFKKSQSKDLLQQNSQGADAMRVKKVILVDCMSLQEMLQHQKENGNQVLLQACF